METLPARSTRRNSTARCGKVRKPGKADRGFQVVHMIDCRIRMIEVFIRREIESWRVQKLMLQVGQRAAGKHNNEQASMNITSKHS